MKQIKIYDKVRIIFFDVKSQKIEMHLMTKGVVPTLILCRPKLHRQNLTIFKDGGIRTERR